jgi:hypothetical protein
VTFCGELEAGAELPPPPPQATRLNERSTPEIIVFIYNPSFF